MSYGSAITVNGSFADTLKRVREELKAEGFGVLTEIDVRATLKAKLGHDMEDYVILGACNPPLARRALETDRSIGLLLPCNVVVRADGPDHTLVQALDPQVMVQVTGRPELKSVADDATTRLRAALDTLAADGAECGRQAVRARRRALRFTRDAMAARYRDLYSALVTKSLPVAA